MAVDYPGAQDMMLPTNYSFSSITPLVIVIHKTGGDGTLDAVHSTFLSTKRSTHFAIDENGQIAQFVPLNRGAGGNCCADSTHRAFWDSYINAYGNLNLCTISIEHCDNTSTNTEPMSQAQINASRALVRWLCNKFGIAADHIKGHNSINATDCPGDYPLTELIAYVQNGGSAMEVPQGWHDDGTTLTAPNGHKVVLGFRDYVLNYPGGWSPDNWPLAEESARDPLEASNPALGAGSWQPFRWIVLEWTSARGVFEAWAGQELLWLRQHPANAPVVDTTALVQAIDAIPEQLAAAVAPLVAKALVEAKKL